MSAPLGARTQQHMWQPEEKDYWWVALALVVGAAFLANRRWEQKRQKAYEAYCLTRGYKFERERPGAEAEFAADFPLFRTGHSPHWGYSITGNINRHPFTAFEYRYTTGGGRSSTTHYCCMVLWEAEGTTFPRFSLAPEGFFQRLGQRFGVQDFDFPEDSEFSAAIQLQGDDEMAVRALFTAARRRHFSGAAMAGTPRSACHVAGAGKRLLWWREARLPASEELDTFLAEGDAIRRVFLED